MSVLFIDTDCELPIARVKEAGIKNIIKMPYTICGEQRYDDLGETYNAKEFFDKVRAGNMPITSGLNAEEYKEYFEPYFEKGEDILYVSFSEKMSSTFTYMDIAVKELSEKYPKAKFTRFDTKGISLGAGIACYYAGKMHSEGKSNAEIIEFLTTFIKRIHLYISPADLFHLKRGGRLTGAQAMLGTLLQVKPIIKLMDGKLVSTEKVNGRNKAIAKLADYAINDVRDTDKYPIIILDADCKEDAEKLRAKVAAVHPDADIWMIDVGPVIGTHCGPDTIAIVFIGDIKE
ncbi:MAG TPA: DegV family protein [Clostridia bacterium]|nr:DegV family protein [Clostridia bacterium]